MGRQLWILASLLLLPILGAALTPPPPAEPGIVSGPTGAIAILVALALLAGLTYRVGRRREREATARQLERQIADALLQEGTLGPGVSSMVELWTRSHAHIEVVGLVPTERSRAAALRVAGQEAARRGFAFDLHDRLTVVRVA